jgi:hypothetical protein
MSKALAHEEIAVSTAVKQLTSGVYDPPEGPSAAFAVIHAEDGPMRYFVTGQNPSQNSGALLEDGDIVELPSIYHIRNFRVIRSGNTNGKLTVTYED